MPYEITAEFEKIEYAEIAANRLKSFAGIENVTITRPIHRKNTVSPFVLPYRPIYGRDKDIMRPKEYGYDTKTSYFEPALSEKCHMKFIAENKNDVTSILHNLGGNKISVSAVIVQPVFAYILEATK